MIGYNYWGIPLIENDLTRDSEIGTVYDILDKQFASLKMLCKNFGKKIDLEKAIAEIKFEVIQTPSNDGHIPVDFDVAMFSRNMFKPEESTDSQFKLKFKMWCKEFVNCLKKIKQKHPWFNAKEVALKILTLKFE